jgi:hypothetical protein
VAAPGFRYLGPHEGGVFKLCGLAFIEHGRVVDLSSAERDRLILADRDVRREVLRASRMHGTSGRLILLRRPRNVAPRRAVG